MVISCMQASAYQAGAAKMMYHLGIVMVKFILLSNILIYFDPTTFKIIFSRSLSQNNIQTVSNFFGVDSEMLLSEKSIIENIDCREPCQRKNAASKKPHK